MFLNFVFVKVSDVDGEPMFTRRWSQDAVKHPSILIKTDDGILTVTVSDKPQYETDAL